jgi:Raf kinase inhibitor-like YbhB/YbcL family protein
MSKSISLSYLSIAVIGVWLAQGQACSPTTITPSPSNSSTATMSIVSTAFANGDPIPSTYTQLGADISPELKWYNVPSSTKELAIIMEDLDTNPVFVHWVIYKIPVRVTSLPTAMPLDETLTSPLGTLQGLNSGFVLGYLGPLPPTGETHHYQFTLYALSKSLDVSGSLSAAALRTYMQGNIITQAKLVGTSTQ